MSEQYTSSKTGSVSDAPSTTTLQRSTASTVSAAKSGCLDVGKNVTAIGIAFTEAVRRMSVAMQELMSAFRRCLVATVRKLTGLLRANQDTASTLQMGSILACFRWVAPNVRSMDMRSTHMYSPFQHTITSLRADATGRPGRANPNKWYRCHTTKYDEKRALYDPRLLYNGDSLTYNLTLKMS